MMSAKATIEFIKQVIDHMPAGWLSITTHRLDIYNEQKAKTAFLENFNELYLANKFSTEDLDRLPTAYDYIRLGHPLSCILEWTIAEINEINPANVIAFSSKMTPLLAILRKNLLDKKRTRVCYENQLPLPIDQKVLTEVYGYQLDLVKVDGFDQVAEFDGSTVFITDDKIDGGVLTFNSSVDFILNTFGEKGSIITVCGAHTTEYVSEIQHVRRRESISMTPIDTLEVLRNMLNLEQQQVQKGDHSDNKQQVISSLKEITKSPTNAIVASSGLSIQYAIMMGLINDAIKSHPGKPIRFIVPPNCYGGTNDQARRVAKCIDNVEVVDLPVDGDNDMISSVRQVLSEMAKEDAVPYIIAEIPTNPRVEVPNLSDLRDALMLERHTTSGTLAVEPVFILDQTFCPNVNFLGEGAILSTIKTISYASGSKFPSGGKCTAGYCVANEKGANYMSQIESHLLLCDNEATDVQYHLLANQLPTMIQRIADAYQNTRAFVEFIQATLPSAKINFVSEELAQQGFTPSVFSLDLPTTGANDEERETNKRALNLQLINLMISEIPTESKFCVSYGQLKGCYWTIPATSTQGTTKEGDKDYIVRASLSPDLDLEKHKSVFKEFVRNI